MSGGMSTLSDIRAELQVRPAEAKARILAALKDSTIAEAAAKLGCNMRTLQRVLAGDKDLARAALAVRSETSRRHSDTADHRWS